MRVLVAGGAGYIGSVMVERLLAESAEVIVYDNLSTGHRAAVPAAATFVRGDLSDVSLLRATLERHPVDAAMHFAAFIQAGESMERPQRYFANNVASVIGLLNVLVEQGVRRIVFSSSAAVYRDGAKQPLVEDAPVEPANPYGETKAMVERILAWYDRLLGLRYASLRYFNAAGATRERGEDHRPESHLIPLILRSALGYEGTLTLHGTDYPTADGTCVRDYVHVADLAEAHLLALRRIDQGSLVCNLGTETGHSVREVVEVVRQVTGRPVPVTEGPRRAGDAVALVASSRRARELLGWQPGRSDLQTIVETAWEWQSSHPKGYCD